MLPENDAMHDVHSSQHNFHIASSAHLHLLTDYHVGRINNYAAKLATSYTSSQSTDYFANSTKFKDQRVHEARGCINSLPHNDEITCTR